MRRLCAALGIALALASAARAEFVARAKDFKCLKAFVPIPGKNFVVYNRNPARLQRAVRIATEDLEHRKYPIGTIIQVFPFEAMVKRGGGFNPSGGGWEFFNLKVSPQGTLITGRTPTPPAARHDAANLLGRVPGLPLPRLGPGARIRPDLRRASPAPLLDRRGIRGAARRSALPVSRIVRRGSPLPGARCAPRPVGRRSPA